MNEIRLVLHSIHVVMQIRSVSYYWNRNIILIAKLYVYILSKGKVQDANKFIFKQQTKTNIRLSLYLHIILLDK